MTKQTLIQQWDSELGNPLNFAARFGCIARRLLAQGDVRIVELEAIVERFVQYHNEGIGQLTHLLAAAEQAAKEGART